MALHQIQGQVMTYAMWGIAVGMALMFSASFYRYRHQTAVVLNHDASAKQRAHDRLREHYGF
jgi:hypothetical protein